MKIIKFQGGLGNQLFQYTFLRNFEIVHHCNSIKGDFSFYEDTGINKDRDTYIEEDGTNVPNIKKLNVNDVEATDEEINEVWILKRRKKEASKFYWRIKMFIERTFNNNYYHPFFLTSYINIKDIIHYGYFDGYWPSWRYVSKIEEELRNELTFKGKYSDKTKKIIEKLSKENAVFIGIRRGDYLKGEANKKLFGRFTIDYYHRAIKVIKKYVNDPIFYVFSDDIEWVKENMDFGEIVTYREKEDQTNDIEELFIMAACKHAIIVNSSFEWWGAWLIKNKNKIIVAPEPWMNDDSPIDIVPPEWHKIERS